MFSALPVIQVDLTYPVTWMKATLTKILPPPQFASPAYIESVILHQTLQDASLCFQQCVQCPTCSENYSALKSHPGCFISISFWHGKMIRKYLWFSLFVHRKLSFRVRLIDRNVKMKKSTCVHLNKYRLPRQCLCNSLVFFLCANHLSLHNYLKDTGTNLHCDATGPQLLTLNGAALSKYPFPRRLKSQMSSNPNCIGAVFLKTLLWTGLSPSWRHAKLLHHQHVRAEQRAVGEPLSRNIRQLCCSCCSPESSKLASDATC